MSERSGNPPAEFDSVEYTTEGGPDLGFGLHERETRLRVDLKTRVAFLNSHQPTADKGGEPLGTFRARLAPDQVVSLQALLAKTTLGSSADAPAGGPWASAIQIRAKRGAEVRSVSFSSQDMEKLSRFESLLSLLDDATFAASQHPFQAVRLEVEAKPVVAGFSFTVKVKNVGSEEVAIPDLETLGRESRDMREHGIGVRVATLPQARPGMTDPPLLWSAVSLAPSDAAKTGGKAILLAPGGERVVHTLPWSSQGAGARIFAQAFLSYYGGPPIVDGHLVIRGQALSAALELGR